MVGSLLLWLVVTVGEGKVGKRMSDMSMVRKVERLIDTERPMGGRGVRIDPSTLPAVGRVSPGYLSLALDTGVVRKGSWPKVLTQPQLVTLTSALGPKYIR